MTVRNMPFLAPAAFTMVMGTGALAMATLEMSQIFPPLCTGFAQFLNILNYALFFPSCALGGPELAQKRAHTAGKFRPAG